MKPATYVLCMSIIASTFLLAPAAAQDAAPAGALYFTNKINADTPTGVKTIAMTDVAPTAAAPVKAYAQTSLFASTYQTQFEYKFAADAVLDGKFSVQTWVSCDVAAAFRPAYQNTANDLQAFRIELYKGATLLGESHSYTALSTCTGSSVIQELKGDITLAAVEFAKNDVLGVRPLLWTTNPPEAQAKNVHFLVGSTTRASAIRGPGLPGAGPAVAASKLIEADLEGDAATIEQSFSNATSDTYRFNWTTDLESAQIVYNASAASGNATIVVQDGSGEEIFNQTITTGDTEGMQELEAVEPGAWVFTVSYDGFQGSLSLTADALPEPSPTGTSGPASTSATSRATDLEADGAPGLGLLGLGLGVLVAVGLVRRRRSA
jgi:hypothetical protein